MSQFTDLNNHLKMSLTALVSSCLMTAECLTVGVKEENQRTAEAAVFICKHTSFHPLLYLNLITRKLPCLLL